MDNPIELYSSDPLNLNYRIKPWGDNMDNNRVMMFRILNILKERLSEEHAITVREIGIELHNRHSLPKPPDRKTIYSHLKLLQQLSEQHELDYEIEHIQDTSKNISAYYVKPPFDESEIKMLCDMVAFSRFIDKSYSNDVIGKLGNLIGQDYKNRYSVVLSQKNQGKIAYNRSFFLNIDLLTEAIEKKCTIQLVYLKYDMDKNFVPVYEQNDGMIHVHPYYLVWTLNHYYLFCEIAESGKQRFLRIDKIRDVKLVENQTYRPLPTEFNLTEYVTNQAFMFGGKSQMITLRCRKDMLGQVIDHFGENANIRKLDDNYFELNVNSSLDSMKYWVLQYITAIDDIRPVELKNITIQFLEDALQRNQIDK